MSQSTKNRIICAVVLIVLIGTSIAIYFLTTRKDKINYLSDVKSSSELGTYSKFVVSTDASECAPLGKDILKKDGTAVDAAITVLLCMALVLPHSLGLGGGSYMTYYDRKLMKGIIYDGREQASQFVKDVKFTKKKLQDGPFSVAVPGELANYVLAHKEFGKLKWASLFEGPIKLARKGVKVNKHLALNIQKSQNRITPELKKILSNKNGELLKEGDTLVREDLADTYQKIADSDDPIGLFYRGELTEIFVEELKESGINYEDFRNYEAKKRDAIVYDLDDENRLLVPTLPSSGIILGFIMKVIAKLKENFIKPGMQYSLKDSAWFNHQLTEIFKHAYSRRAVVADEVYSPKLTEELLKNFTFIGNETNPYFENVVQKVKESKQTHKHSFYGGDGYFVSDNGTAHMSIIDKYGNAISVTSTINIYFGSGIVSRTGIIFNDENDDFSVKGITNFFGLPPSKANLIEPKKRPASSMCPIIVVNRKTDEAKLSMGAAGGSLIISGMAQALTRILYMNEDIKVAIDQWRFHHQLFPNQFQYEKGFNKELLKELNETYKHDIITIPNRRCIITAVSKDKDGKLYANTDYRKGGSISGE